MRGVTNVVLTDRSSSSSAKSLWVWNCETRANVPEPRLTSPTRTVMPPLVQCAAVSTQRAATIEPEYVNDPVLRKT
jgi:hypothetical protein